MSPLSFAVANVLGALLYVPYAVGLGYGIGYSLGDVIQRFAGRIDYGVIAAIVVLTLAFAAARVVRAGHAAH
jgi:membrane protein DedA with SNARE-associated domain